MIDQDGAATLELYRQAVDNHGNVDSIFVMANLLEAGAPGIERNTPAAIELYRRAIDCHGDVKSVLVLGAFYSHGNLDQQVWGDHDRAIQLFNNAHSSGSTSNADKTFFATLLCSEGTYQNTEYARKLLQGVLQGDPIDPLASFQLGHIKDIESLGEDAHQLISEALLEDARLHWEDKLRKNRLLTMG